MSPITTYQSDHVYGAVSEIRQPPEGIPQSSNTALVQIYPPLPPFSSPRLPLPPSPPSQPLAPWPLFSQNFPRIFRRSDHSPAWLDEWLESGAHLRRAGGGGLYDHESRCPRVGDIWELLELLLAWWAERVCAVAAGFPVYREAEVEGGAEYGGGGDEEPGG